MKKKKIIIISFVLFTGISMIGIAGVVRLFTKQHNGEETFVDGKEELKKLHQFFLTPKLTYDIHGTIFLYDKESGGKLVEKTSFSTYKNQEGSYLHIGSLQTFLYQNISLQVDTAQKFIIVKELIQDALTAPFGGMYLDKILSDTNTLRISAKYIDRSPEERELIIENDYSPEIKQMMISYNPSNFHIAKTEIKWWKNYLPDQDSDNGDCWLSKTQISYSDPQAHSIKKEIEKFVVHDNMSYSTTQAYAEYRFDFLPLINEEAN